MVCPLADCPRLFLAYFPFPCALGCDQSHTQQKLQILEVHSLSSLEFHLPLPVSLQPLPFESPRSGSDLPCLIGTCWNWVRTQAERDTNSTWELEAGWAAAQPSGPQPVRPALESPLCVCVCVFQASLPCHLVYSLVCDTVGDYVIILLWGPWHICRAPAHLCCTGTGPTLQMLH